MNKPYKYEVVTEFWNGKKITESTNDLTLNDNRLGIVNETWYIDTRYEAKLRLYNCLINKGVK